MTQRAGIDNDIGPLSGVRVLELGNYIAAPTAGRMVAEAAGGLRELIGDPDRPPARTGVSIGDSIAGIYAAFGTVMALFQRQRVKAPLAQRIIDVALNEAVLSVMESLVPDYLAYGV